MLRLCKTKVGLAPTKNSGGLGSMFGKVNYVKQKAIILYIVSNTINRHDNFFVGKYLLFYVVFYIKN